MEGHLSPCSTDLLHAFPFIEHACREPAQARGHNFKLIKTLIFLTKPETCLHPDFLTIAYYG